MLSRGAGAVAFQKVVNKVADLPSPLDAEPGTRIIVRETEEVYGLNAMTRMWEPIGTLKKVGGKRPEELAAHVDADSNPHKTTLQQVLETGAKAELDGEVLVTGKAISLRLQSGASELKLGPTSSAGVLWMNIGSGKKTILRAVNADGDDMFVVDTDGLVSGGSATFLGGFKGPAEFEDEIFANEGVHGATGYDLVLAGDKGVVLQVSGQPKAILTDSLLTLGASLEMNGDLRLHGHIGSDLIPSGDLQLGHPKARWAKAAVGDLDVAGSFTLQVAANSKVNPFQIAGPAPAAGVLVTAKGDLGLGTDKPGAKLDVRGDVLVDSAMRLGKDGMTCGDWRTSYAENLSITHKGSGVLSCGPAGTTLFGGAKVTGDLSVIGSLIIEAVSGSRGDSISFKPFGIDYAGDEHRFSGPLVVKTAAGCPLDVPGLSVVEGELRGHGDIVGWRSARLKDELTVGSAVFSESGIKTPGELELDASAVVAKGLRLQGSPKIEVLNTLRLQGPGGAAEFSMAGDVCGLSLEGKRWELLGLAHMESNSVQAGSVVANSAQLGAASITKSGVSVAGDLSIGGLVMKKVSEELELTGGATGDATKFELPAGVRIEAVVVKLLTDVKGPRFLRVGDRSDFDRFASAAADMRAGSVIRGMAHWEKGRAVQRVKGPIVVSGDGVTAPSGKVLVTVHYVDPAAL